MNKNLMWLVIALAALLIGAVAAQAIQTYYYPQTATVGEIELTIYLDDVEWINGTAIDWGTVYPGETWYSNLTVKNLIDTPVLVYIEFDGLPLNWVQTWDANGTILDYEESIFGWLNITIPIDAAVGLYEWDSYIKGEYT